MEDKNYMYPPPTEEQQKLCLQYQSLLKNKKDGAGEIKEVVVSNEVKKTLNDGVQIWNEMFCKNCNGNHTWFIAGGYASYVSNYTDRYSDIDIFINCTANFRKTYKKRMFTTNIPDKPSMRWNFHGNNVIDIHCNITNVTLQFVQVDFEVKNITDGQHFVDTMMLYVLSTFDIPICRVAMQLKFEEDSNMAYVIDLRAIEGQKGTPTIERIQKYDNRKIKTATFKVPGLQILCLRSFFTKHN